MARSNASIARASYRAYADNDRDAIEALIADDFRFTSPLDNRIDRATYFARCWPVSARIADFRFVRVLEQDDTVVVTYEGRNTDGGGFRNTEVLTLRDGLIVEVEVYFGWSLPHPAAPGGYRNGAGGK